MARGRPIKVLKNRSWKRQTTLYRGDCLSVMDRIPDESIDMILTDLPYHSHNHKSSCNKTLDYEQMWEQYNRIIKPNGAIILMTQGKDMFNVYNSNPDMYRYDLVWNKMMPTGFLNCNRMPLRNHKNIMVFYKNTPKYNPQMKDAGENKTHHKGSNINVGNNRTYGDFRPTESDTCSNGLKHPSSVLEFQKPHPSKAIHNNELPVELCEWLIRTYTDSGDTVLDSCMGCGTTGIACQNIKRKFIGIELDKDYYMATVERLLK